MPPPSSLSEVSLLSLAVLHTLCDAIYRMLWYQILHSSHSSYAISHLLHAILHLSHLLHVSNAISHLSHACTHLIETLERHECLTVWKQSWNWKFGWRVFLHDICERISFQHCFFFFAQKRNEKRDTSTTARLVSSWCLNPAGIRKNVLCVRLYFM